MQKRVNFIIICIFCMLIGILSMYFITIKYPKITSTDNIGTQKIVTVNDNGISDGIDNIYDAVVVVENYYKGSLSATGSGFIYTKDGYIITNHHVIDGSDEIKVILMNGNSLNAKLIGSDEYADIAIIQISSSDVPAVAKIGNSEISKVGDTVFTIGSPVSSNYAGTVTRGILSGKNRMVEVSVKTSKDWIMNVMQTDAAINPGNSGGPLCNVSGEVIGVNSMKLIKDSIEGIGFAIPIEDALVYATKIINHEDIKRSYLGISMYDMSVSNYYLNTNGIYIDDSITSGVIIAGVANNGPANKAGIKKGDVIVKIGNYDIKNAAELKYYLYKYEPNSKINVDVIRGKEKLTYSVILGES